MAVLKRVSMRDVAEASGVSVMTVSLALRNRPYVADATRRRVLQVAEKLGYRPDPALSALVAYRGAKAAPKFHGVIIYLNNTDMRACHKSMPLHKAYFQGASARAAELGFVVEEFWLGQKGMTPSRASQILYHRQVAGLLVAPQSRPHSQLDMDWHLFPSVTFGYSLESPRLPVVSTHNFQCLQLAMDNVAGKGYRRVGFVATSDQNERVLRTWSAAFEDQQRRLFPKTNHVPMLLVKPGESRAFYRWFERYRPDTLLFGCMFAREWLKEKDIAIGRDVGAAMIFESMFDSEMAHVDHNSALVGRTAMDVLSGLIYRNEKGIQPCAIQTLVDGKWVDGPSLPACESR